MKLSTLALFADHLCKTFQPLPQRILDENISRMEKIDELEIQPGSLKELKDEIKSNKNAKKMPRYDMMTGRIIKELPEKAVNYCKLLMLPLE